MKQAGLRLSLDDYLGRIRRYCPCQEVEIRDGSEPQVLERFEKAIPPRCYLVALEVGGKALDSHGLADFVSRCERDAVGNVAFLVGGAYGLPAELSRRADLQLSLSAMTLPHRIARLVLAEQIYRAFTINRNEPYSH